MQSEERLGSERHRFCHGCDSPTVQSACPRVAGTLCTGRSPDRWLDVRRSCNGGLAASLRQRHLCLREPERHRHGAIHRDGSGQLRAGLLLLAGRSWVYHTVLTKVEACIVGSFVIKSRCRNRAVPAIKRSCNSGMSVMCAAAWITAKLIGYSR